MNRWEKSPLSGGDDKSRRGQTRKWIWDLNIIKRVSGGKAGGGGGYDPIICEWNNIRPIYIFYNIFLIDEPRGDEGFQGRNTGCSIPFAVAVTAVFHAHFIQSVIHSSIIINRRRRVYIDDVNINGVGRHVFATKHTRIGLYFLVY